MLTVASAPFEPTNAEQTQLWAKTSDGWRYTTTEARCLVGSISIDQYISQCVPYCMASDGKDWIAELLNSTESNNVILCMALQLWAATVLLMKGWEVKDGNWITDTSDPYVNTSPAPKLLQMQLDTAIEDFIVRTEATFLDRLQQVLEHRKGDRKKAFAAVVIFLRIIEKDTWRLMYWLRHSGKVLLHARLVLDIAENSRNTSGGIRILPGR